MNGGFIGGEWYRPENAPESLLGERDVITWGYVVADKYGDVVKQTMYRTLCTTFTICYNTKKSDKSYITCKIWGDEDAAHIATTLERGDWVGIAGKLQKTKFTVRQGPEEGKVKTVMYLTPAILLPMPLIEGLMAVAGSEKIANFIKEEEDAKGSDTVESADDYEEILDIPQGSTPFDDDYELSI